MKRPTFFHGVLVAAGLGFLASAVVATLTPFLGIGTVVRLAVPALSLAYLLYLLGRSRERLGRVTTVAAWCVLALVAWFAAPPLPLYVLIHAGAIWLVRSLYFYTGVLPAVMDLGLNALAVAAMVWAIAWSGSVFLATWCFFLVQALFVAIPPAIHSKKERPPQPVVESESFERARRQAEQALRQLFAK